MGNILKEPNATGHWLQYLEFNLNEIPIVRSFRSQYPQATFEQYYQWLLDRNKVQGQPQGSPQGQPQFEMQGQPAFNQLNMGYGQSAPANVRPSSPIDVLRQIDTGHFGQFIQQLA